MKKLIKIFSIEDDTFYGKMIKHSLEKNINYEVTVFTSGEDFLNHFHENPDIVTIDYNLPGLNGLDILKKVHEYNSEIATIAELEQCVSKLAKHINLQRDVENLRDQIIDRHKYASIIGESSAALRSSSYYKR